MAWPKNINQVACYGFPRTILPALIKVIEEEKVEWIPEYSKLFVDLGSGRFKFADCIWELEEMTEIVTSLRLIEGDVTSEDLTVAVLRS